MQTFTQWTPNKFAPLWHFVIGTGGADPLSGSSARDIMLGFAGADTLSGAGGADILLGGADDDTLTGGSGNDLLIGGTGGDTYVFSTLDSAEDTIRDNGNAPTLNGYYSSGLDEVRLTGFASLDEALHSIDMEISGDNLIISYDNAGTTGQITVTNNFAGARYAIETLSFGSGPVYHVSLLSGDQFTYSVHSGPDAGGEDVVLGTNGADEIYSGIGNDIILGGGGADHFMFHDEEASNGSHDIILDFDVAQDVIDFTDILSLTMAGVSVEDNAWGNAVITTAYGTIELAGVAAIDVSQDLFAFA